VSDQIIQQPDGRFAVFSTGTDTLVIVDATADELADYYAERAAKNARQSAQRTIDRVRAGEARSVYAQFVMTWDEAVTKSRANGGELP
jgi:hypothetical protein